MHLFGQNCDHDYHCRHPVKRGVGRPINYSGNAAPNYFAQRSSNKYSCCASRMINVRFAPEATTNSAPSTPGAVVMNEMVPSGFLRLPTSLFHSPKSNMVDEPEVLTSIFPSAAFS